MRLRKLAVFALLAGLSGQGSGHAARQIYDDTANARRQILNAVRAAFQSKRNIVLVFGANWCPDCQALHAEMVGPLASMMQRYFVVVPISVGNYDRNKDVARQYHVSLARGIPAIAILDAHGKLLHAEKPGEFSNAGSMSPSVFAAFFKKWEPQR